MSDKHRLRGQRAGTVINLTSRQQEKALSRAMLGVCDDLNRRFTGIRLEHEGQWRLQDVVATLRKQFPDVDFHHIHDKSSMKPDGGILNIVRRDGVKLPLLIAEKKNQGTNNLRLAEGKAAQARGNAIERLGKNVIGFRAALLSESIFPFVCFGDGCDFRDESSILDRVVTIAMFGRLNHEYLHNQAGERFNRGTFYFREAEWKEKEMRTRCYSIAEKSVFYYFSKYGETNFVPSRE